ncbi:MAG TPA: helix-turn-helix transcriptional regulator [Candidatus Binatus sp.]|nr:helix-turn-helix transcriptional regulator [Candidatus Binatus sp.]
MRELGGQLRRVRGFLGLSQEQVARLAGVSQGAMSRLEAGRGLATPLFIVIKVHTALADALRAFDPELVDDQIRQTLGLDGFLRNGNGGGEIPITRDPELDELVQLYRGLPEGQRRTLIAIMRATATSLTRASRALPG